MTITVVEEMLKKVGVFLGGSSQVIENCGNLWLTFKKI
jgi:hypothetical protein